MSTPRQSSAAPELRKILLLLTIAALALCVSKDWLGVRDVYIGASEWLGQQMADMVVEGATTPTPAP